MTTRVFRLAFWFLLGCLLGGYGVRSYAATTYQVQVSGLWYMIGGSQYGSSSPEETCKKIFLAVYGVTNTQGTMPWVYYPSNVTATCKTTSGKPSVQTAAAALTCSFGGTRSGNECVSAPDCPAGKTRDHATGSCVAPACPADQEMVGTECMVKCTPPEVRGPQNVCGSFCSSLVVTPTGSCVKPVVCSGSSNLPMVDASQYPICAGVKTDDDKCPPGGVVIGTFAGKPICLSPPPDDPSCSAIGGSVTGTINGQPICSKPAANPTCADGSASVGTVNGQPVCNTNCPVGQAGGTVNGVTSCYPVGGVTDKTTTQKDGVTGTITESETKDAGGNTTGTSGSSGSSATTCQGDRCTTKSETTDSSGNKTTTTTTEDKGDYCAKNPKASVCTGDTEQEAYCKDNPKSVACTEMGTFSDPEAMPTKAIGISSLVPTIFQSNASCPSDLQLPKGATFTFSSLCDYAAGIRLFVLITAWLAAGFFVLGIKGD